MLKLCTWTSCGRNPLVHWQQAEASLRKPPKHQRRVHFFCQRGVAAHHGRFFFPIERWRIKQGNVFLSFSSGCIRTYSTFSWYLEIGDLTLAVFRWLELSCLASLTMKSACIRCRCSLLMIKLIEPMSG